MLNYEMTKIYKIDPQGERHRRKASGLLRAARRHIEAHPEGLEGYVVISWDMRGGTAITDLPGGPISRDMLPTHVLSSLLRVN